MRLDYKPPMRISEILWPPLLFSVSCAACLMGVEPDRTKPFLDEFAQRWAIFSGPLLFLIVGISMAAEAERRPIGRGLYLGSAAGALGFVASLASGGISPYLVWLPLGAACLSSLLPKAEEPAPTDWGALARHLSLDSDERPPSPAGAFPSAEVPVEVGAFRVDPVRALEKLGRFQSAQADAFLRAWLRLAVASDAPLARLDTAAYSLRLSFGGRPLPQDALENPFAALFSGVEDDVERRGYLAYGLLGALRDSPLSLRISSGGHDRRRTFAVGRPAEDAPGSDSVLDVAWGWMRFRRPAALAADVKDVFCCPSTELRVNGRAWDPGLRSADWERKAIPGGLALGHRGPAHPPGRICLYRRGIRVGEHFSTGDRDGWEIHLEAPGLTLDVSQECAVVDSGYRRALYEAKAAAERWT